MQKTILKETLIKKKRNIDPSKRRDEFIIKSQLKFNSLFSFPNIVYVKSSTPINIECSIHGEFTTTPTIHLGSETGACQGCLMDARAKQFFVSAYNKFGDKFDYTDSVFLGSTSPIEIRCKEHGAFTTSAKHHIETPSGSNNPSLGGCKECARETQREKVTKPLSHWEELVTKKSNGTMTLVDYIGGFGTNDTSNIAVINCPIHGEFHYSFTSLTKTADTLSCPHCFQENNSWGGRTRRIDIPGTLYFIYFKDLNLYKLGVTARTVKARFKGYIDYEVLWTKEFNTLAEAYDEETRLFRKYSEIRYKGKENLLKLGGSTELLHHFIPYEWHS